MSPRRTIYLAPLRAISLAMLLAACSLPGSEAPGTALTDPALTKGAAACAEGNGCVAQLKGMVTGADRGWIGRPQAPQQFADGTRLFAYRALRPKLSCRELSLAIGEIAAASKRLLDPASAIPQDRAQNVAALANDAGVLVATVLPNALSNSQ